MTPVQALLQDDYQDTLSIRFWALEVSVWGNPAGSDAGHFGNTHSPKNIKPLNSAREIRGLCLFQLVGRGDLNPRPLSVL